MTTTFPSNACFYLIGLNLTPHDFAGRIRRALTWPSGLSLRIERIRPLHFPQAVFWFQAEFASDQKEQEVLPVALDLHYSRQVRHLDRLLDPSGLAEVPSPSLPEAPHSSTAAAYRVARDRAMRTFAALANTRSRELNERLERQIVRMTRYYADLRSELEEPARRSRDQEADGAKLAARREAVAREERMRVAESGNGDWFVCLAPEPVRLGESDRLQAVRALTESTLAVPPTADDLGQNSSQGQRAREQSRNSLSPGRIRPETITPSGNFSGINCAGGQFRHFGVQMSRLHKCLESTGSVLGREMTQE